MSCQLMLATASFELLGLCILFVLFMCVIICLADTFKKVEEKDEQIKKLNEEIADLNSKIASLNSLISKRDTEIYKYSEKITKIQEILCDT